MTDDRPANLTSRRNRRAFTKGAVGRADRRRRYYLRFRGGDNRVVRLHDGRR